jgi:hypothetical protein
MLHHHFHVQLQLLHHHIKQSNTLHGEVGDLKAFEEHVSTSLHRMQWPLGKLHAIVQISSKFSFEWN